MLSQVVVANDLTLVVGKEAVRLTPSEGLCLAERLIRRSTARMVEEEFAVTEPVLVTRSHTTPVLRAE